VFQHKQNQKAGAPAIELKGEAGFSILETSIALVLMTVVGLGAASLFYYSVKNTSTAGDRTMSMAVAQQKMEQFRNVKFTDSALSATTGTTSTITRSGRQYTVFTTIVNSNVVNGSPTVKTVTVRVTPVSDSTGWVSNITSVFGSVTIVAQRTTLVLGPNRAF
jgi:Tfp pilus assembly protein PilV